MLCLILNKLFYGAAARSIHLIKDIAASSSRSSNIPINYLIILPFYNETSSFFADIWRNKNSAVNSQEAKNIYLCNNSFTSHRFLQSHTIRKKLLKLKFPLILTQCVRLVTAVF